MLRAIIFDFDGVIVESMDIKARAFAFLFRDHPEHVDEIVKLHMFHGGMPRFEKFEIIYNKILRKPLSEEQKDALGRQFSDFVYKEVVRCPFVAGAEEFLKKYHKKYPLFIVSGTPDNEMKAIVKERGMGKYFREVLGSPVSKITHNAGILKRHNFNPEETIFVGDSIDDWKAAEAVGIKFILRSPNNDYCKEITAYAVIDNILELEKIINGC
jgi:phosphoglycolate phosphatase